MTFLEELNKLPFFFDLQEEIGFTL